MKCQKCGKNATTQVIQIVNGQMVNVMLCSDCAEELGVGGMFSGYDGFGTFSPFDFFDDFDIAVKMFEGMFEQAGLLGSAATGLTGSHAAPRSASKSSERCPVCGSTFNDIVSRGKLGCSECYEHFAKQLQPTIDHIYGIAKDSAPVREPSAKAQADPKAEAVARLAELQRQLKEAVAVEDYEKAAEIHKKIKQLEAQ